MFLNYMAYTTCILVNQCGREQETYQSALPAEIWYQEVLIMTNRDGGMGNGERGTGNLYNRESLKGGISKIGNL